MALEQLGQRRVPIVEDELDRNKVNNKPEEILVHSTEGVAFDICIATVWCTVVFQPPHPSVED